MTDEEIQQAAKVIRDSAENGVMPLPIFNAFSQVAVLSPVDLYAFVEVGNDLNIIVAKRPEEDEFLSGKWHVPGKIMITADESFEDTIERILKTEMPGTVLLSHPTLFDNSYQSTLRGKEHVASFWAIANKLPSGTDGEEIILASIDELPQPFLKEQITRIKRAYHEAKSYIENSK